ncbi:MAG: sulfotransferase [Rhodothermales bacterium]
MGAPFFIVGASRSGTTMMRLLLNAHSKIGVPKEMAYFEQCAIAGAIDTWQSPQFKRGTYEDFVRGFLKKKHVALEGLDIEKLTADILGAGATSLDIPIRKALDAWAEKEGKDIWGEKTPKNLFYVDYIHAIMPDARFIYIVRDPRAVVNSMNRFARFVDDSVLNAFNWLQAAEYGYKLLQRSVPAEKRLEIKYENLVSDVEGTARQICAFLEEPFEEEMLAFYTKSGSDLHPNANELGGTTTLTKPITTVSVEKWRNQLAARDITLVETVCADAMKVHGYESVGEKPGMSERLEVRAKLKYCNWQQERNKHLRSYQLAFKPFEKTLHRIKNLFGSQKSKAKG